MNKQVAHELASLLNGAASGPRWFQMRWLPNVEGLVDGREVAIEFPDGGEPWRVQRRLMRVTVSVPDGVTLKIGSLNPDGDLGRLDLSKEELTQVKVGTNTAFEIWGSALKIADGRARYTKVLAKKVDEHSPAQLLEELRELIAAVDLLCIKSQSAA